jgi:NDP-sugar pyrophosphorylase family protein
MASVISSSPRRDGELIDSRVEGRVAIERGARLERTTVRGPAIIGRGAVLTDAYIGPYTAIGDHVVVANAEIEHAIVLEGSSIQDLNGRIEASLIGKNVAIARGGHRLDAVEEHGLVRHRHELLRARVRDRAQPGAAAAGEDQSLKTLHQYAPPSFEWSQDTTRVGVNRSPTRLGACFSTIAVTDSSSVPA